MARVFLSDLSTGHDRLMDYVEASHIKWENGRNRELFEAMKDIKRDLWDRVQKSFAWHNVELNARQSRNCVQASLEFVKWARAWISAE